MFEKLSEKFIDIFKTIRGKATISEKNVEDVIEQIKIALIDADVNLRVVRRFINSVFEEARGEKVLRTVNPEQQFIKIVNDKLIALLGGGKKDLEIKGKDTLSNILLMGLQGSGKTTTVAKLANHLKKKGRKVLLVACDLQRAAAVEQLSYLAEQAGVDIYKEENSRPEVISKNAVEYAKKGLYDICIFDTAGRMQIDKELMDELLRVKKIVNPSETLLVADSMTGQAAADIANSFNEKLGISGIILTKFDSDTRGGAALSIASVTNKPIKFIGTGERLENLEIFYPDRMASRILGMGDIVSLVEKAQEIYTEKESKELQKKISKNGLNLEDYLEQIRSVKKMGSLKNLAQMLPGLSGKIDKDKIDEGLLKKEEAILSSMTKKERLNHLIIGPTRRTRIARGSGTSVSDVARLLKKFEKTRLMMKKIGKDRSMQNQIFGSP